MPPAFRIKPSAFLHMAQVSLKRDPDRGSFGAQYDWFRSHFGCAPSTCAILWKKLVNYNALPLGGKPMHFLWALRLLYRYETEPVVAGAFDVDEDTFRKWSWALVNSISMLQPVVVSLPAHSTAKKSLALVLSPLFTVPPSIAGTVVFCSVGRRCAHILSFALRADTMVEQAAQRHWRTLQDLSGWNRFQAAAAISPQAVVFSKVQRLCLSIRGCNLHPIRRHRLDQRPIQTRPVQRPHNLSPWIEANAARCWRKSTSRPWLPW